MIAPFILQTKSCGELKLKSKDPLDDPLIDPRYLSHPDDLKCMVEALNTSLQLGNHALFKKFGTEFNPNVCPGCENHVHLSEEYLKCLAKQLSSAGLHLVGTAKMGNASDPMAVVDPELRVYGAKGLRVVDCSVMPEPPSANTNAPAIMTAEKAADMIKITYPYI